MVDLKLIEKLLLVLASPETGPNISKIFKMYKDQPVDNYVASIEKFQEFWRQDQSGINAIACFMAGVFMADLSSKDAKTIDQVFLQPLEQLYRHRGENVVDFQAKKVDKR